MRNLIAILFCVFSPSAFAQSFGQDVVNQVNAGYAQTSFGQVQQIQRQNQIQSPQPVVNMGGGEYMTPNGPIVVLPDGSMVATPIPIYQPYK